MRRSLEPLARVTVAVLVAVAVGAWPAPAQARTAPETLADRRPVQAGPVEPGFPIDYLGVLWDADDSHDGGAEAHGAVRFRHDGDWGPWIRLIEDGADGDGLWASGLVGGGDAEAYQVRGIPDDAAAPRAVAINTTDGSLVEVGETQGGAAHAVDNARCRSRADWGADESLRLDAQGNEVWPPDFHTAQVLTVHHTATDNDDPDPEATVRAIYRYHAVDQGWGDIGYQYLVDESGVVYEGRWSGSESASCEADGTATGSEFAHETPSDLDGDGITDEIVTAAHTGGWNSGNLGVALLGDFTDHPRWGAEPKAAAVGALEDVLAELAVRHGLDPLGMVHYVNPVSGAEKDVNTISGHRDYTATECPGERLYDQLPTIRQNVAAKASTGDGGGGGDPGDPGDAATAHVGDLDGMAQDAPRGHWQATVTITVVDGAGAAVAGASVSITWTTTGTAAACTTGGDGTCSVASPQVHKSTGSMTLRVDGVAHDTLTYDATANRDPDGDSDGTTIVVAKG